MPAPRAKLPGPGPGPHDTWGSRALVSLPASPADTLEVSRALARPHSFPNETCRCRPGNRANAWPRAQEPLPTCQDSLEVCVSNPSSAGGAAQA